MTNELQDLALNSAHIHVCAESRGECARGRKKIIFAVVWLIMLEKTEEAHP